MKGYGLVALIAFGLVLTGCGKGKFAGNVTRKGNILTYPLINKPTEFDPALVQDGDTIDLIQNIFEGLVTWSDVDGHSIVGNLAKDWTVSSDGRTYTFHLKHGIKFHSGREMTAEDVAYSLNRAVDPDLASQTVDDYLSPIDGYAIAHSGKSKTMSGVKVLDPYTISITTDKPRPYFLGDLTYPDAFVVDKDVLTPGKKMTSVREMDGTGPFVASSYTDGQIFHLTAFKDYHEGAPKIDGIDRPIMPDSSSRFNAFKRGELDYLPIQRQDIRAAETDKSLKPDVHFFPRPATYYVGLNLGIVPQFKDLRVRQAFAMAIDRDKIVNDNLDGQNPRADGFLPPGVLGHRDHAAVYPFDVKKAQQLLAQAGYPGGKGFPQISISYRAEQTDVRNVADAVAQQLHENLGIDVAQSPMEWGAYLQKNNSKKLAFFHMRWAADYLDPQDFISLFFTTNGNENKVYYSNPKVDALCDKADSDLNQDERVKLYQQAEDIVMQDVPMIPLYVEVDCELISPRVHGLRNSLFGHLPHYKVTLDNQ